MNNSREKILAAIAKNKAAYAPLPEIEKQALAGEDPTEEFSRVAISSGSKLFKAKDYPEIEEIIRKEFPDARRIVSRVGALSLLSEEWKQKALPHSYENVDLAILEGKLGVAENGSIWLSEKEMGQRALPFICQHLVLIIREKELVSNMHQAYELLGNMQEGYGTFIAGPSKTADIEQSLVLGAHGPRSLTIFLL